VCGLDVCWVAVLVMFCVFSFLVLIFRVVYVRFWTCLAVAEKQFQVVALKLITCDERTRIYGCALSRFGIMVVRFGSRHLRDGLENFQALDIIKEYINANEIDSNTNQ
jgi:hypothetical protein